MTDNTVVSLNTPQDPLTELIRQGARYLIAQAVEAELQQLLAQHQNVMVDGKQAIVCNGFLPERTLQTASSLKALPQKACWPISSLVNINTRCRCTAKSHCLLRRVSSYREPPWQGGLSKSVRSSHRFMLP